MTFVIFQPFGTLTRLTARPPPGVRGGTKVTQVKGQ